MIKAKYGSQHFDLMATEYKPSSKSPWKYILRQKDLVYGNIQCVIGNGSTTAFWHDSWFADYTFQQKLPKLFQLAGSKNVSMKRCGTLITAFGPLTLEET